MRKMMNMFVGNMSMIIKVMKEMEMMEMLEMMTRSSSRPACRLVKTELLKIFGI